MTREPQLPPKPERRTQFSASRIGLEARAVLSGALFAAFLALAGCSPSGTAFDAQHSDTKWQEFQGTWTAAVSRHVPRLGADRQGSIALFDGMLLLAGPSRPGVGFRAEAIVRVAEPEAIGR